MSSKGVLGIKCLFYRCGWECGGKGDVTLSKSGYRTRLLFDKVQNFEDFVQWFPYTRRELLVSVNALVRTIQQLTTGQAWLFQPTFAFLMEAACKLANSASINLTFQNLSKRDWLLTHRPSYLWLYMMSFVFRWFSECIITFLLPEDWRH